MTPKEFRKSKRIHYAPYTIEQMDNYLEEYAKMKCKELLDIVAEKAEITGCCSSPHIDKDSILNCVDLENFCGGTPSS